MLRGAKPAPKADKHLRAKAPQPPAVSPGRTVEYVRSGGVRLGVVNAPPTVRSLDIKDIDGTKHKIAPDQLLWLWPKELGVLPHHPTPVRALPRDARRLRTLWDQLKESEAPMATADIATFLFGALSPKSFAVTSDLLSRQRCLFKRAAPLGGWLPLSRPASENAQRNFFREEVEGILAGKKSSFVSPEHAEALDNLCLYYLSSINGSRNAYVTRQQLSASLLHSCGRPRTPESAAQLLLDLGYWKESARCTVRPFTREQCEASLVLRNSPREINDPSSRVRKDLSRLPAFYPRRDGRGGNTALGFEVRDDGSSWLLVHMPDLSRWLAQGSVLRNCVAEYLISFSPSGYRLPLIPAPGEAALAFQRARYNSAITVAFSDSVSERRSEIFLSKISPITEVNSEVLTALHPSKFTPRMAEVGIQRRSANALRRVASAVAPPSTDHESFWTAVSGLQVRAINELRTFLKSMNAPFDPATAFSSDTYLNLLAHDQLHSLLSGNGSSVSQEQITRAKQATDACMSALSSDYTALHKSAVDVLAAQARHQQQLFGLGADDVVELLGVVMQSGSFGTRVMIHPVNHVSAVRPEGTVYPGEFVRAEVNLTQRTIERITKLV